MLVAREEKAWILEKALAKVSADLDAEWAKAEATWKEYLDKMEAHTWPWQKCWGEKKVKLDRRERDLSLHKAALVEVRSRRFNPWDNHEELMDFAELRRILQDAEVDHVTEVGRLAVLVRDISRFWWTLACLPSRGSPKIHTPLATSWKW
jgi:hypothetical protein